MRTFFLLMMSLCAATFAMAQQKAWLIVPGKSIGQVTIDAPSESLSALGKPDGGDAAMNKAWRIWYARNKDQSVDSSHLLAVYTAMRTQDTQYVRQIRVNSPKFKTAKGAGVGTAMSLIKKAYPGIKRTRIYERKNHSLRIEVYDDNKRGIAFETTNGRTCSMVVVHAPGEPLENYMDYHPGFDNTLEVLPQR
ncbi:hypothetical protein [Chitinophaga vietnamensis]|uniref:hypothetical protein n=1 Tax=Chitinophaga vietnamensis TaxID=2593957 RepID=UPI001177DEED|nr:hypothetical protein [Chitinophaga vietnamensis]